MHPVTTGALSSLCTETRQDGQGASSKWAAQGAAHYEQRLSRQGFNPQHPLKTNRGRGTRGGDQGWRDGQEREEGMDRGGDQRRRMSRETDKGLVEGE